jgi:hypothetical protein
MQEESGITPKALLDRPELNQRWHFAKDTFDALGGSRRYTAGGPANIPFSEFYLYAKAYAFEDSDTTEVWEDLKLLDTIWLSKVAEKQAASQKTT